MSDYAEKHQSNISDKHKGELLEEDQLHKENIQDFNLVENRIDEIIKGAKREITILFSTTKTVKRKETQSILKLLKNKTRPNILVRALFPLGIDDIIIDGYSEVANVRIFERKLENNDIIIVPDDTKVLLVSTKDPIDYGKETAYTISYSDSKEITYTFVTMFEKLWLIQTVTKLVVR
jgi:sugar-specific transcriptional regulator TrmB